MTRNEGGTKVLIDQLRNARTLRRPSLKFIASLPTLSVKESTYKNLVLWKVELPEPITILYADYPILNTFWVEIITETYFDEDSGRYSVMLIGIKKTKSANTFIIEPHEEDFYTKNMWWYWIRPRFLPQGY